MGRADPDAGHAAGAAADMGSEGALRTEAGLEVLRAAAAAHLSAAGQLQVATALDMLAATEAQLGSLRHKLADAAARSMRPAKPTPGRRPPTTPTTPPSPAGPGASAKPVGGPRRPLLAFRRPCQRTRRWYP